MQIADGISQPMIAVGRLENRLERGGQWPYDERAGRELHDDEQGGA
jgi:hypothetical protein